jgi:hypothetical protein
LDTESFSKEKRTMVPLFLFLPVWDSRWRVTQGWLTESSTTELGKVGICK